MSDQDIDRLFREKLSDRPFTPSAKELADAQSLIQGHGGSAWWKSFLKFGGLAMLLAGSGYLAFQALSDPKTSEIAETTTVEQPSAVVPMNADVPLPKTHDTASSAATDGSRPATTDAVVNGTSIVAPTTSTLAQNASVRVQATPKADSGGPAPSSTPSPSAASSIQGHVSNAKPSERIAELQQPPAAVDEGRGVDRTSATLTGSGTPAEKLSAAGAVDGSPEEGKGAIAADTFSEQTPVPGGENSAAGSSGEPGSTIVQSTSDRSNGEGSQVTNAGQEGIASGLPTGELPQQPAGSESPGSNAIMAETLPATLSDSTTIAKGLAMADSASVPAPAASQPISIGRKPRLELHAFAGIARTTSNRNDGAISPNVLGNYGLEFALRWNKISAASGIHAGNYGETVELTTPGSSEVITSINYIIADSVVIIDSVVYDVGDTIEVIFQEDTIVVPSRTENDQVRVSYMEVPLLLGYEHSKGHWSYGIQGGVVAGFLTARSGRYAGVNEAPDTEIANETFQSISLGYLLRPCLKYNINERWSIGLEPFLKGHFVDIVREGPLQGLRYSGWGTNLGLFWKPGARRTSVPPKP